MSNATATSSGQIPFAPGPFIPSPTAHLIGTLQGRKYSLMQYIYTAIAVEDWHAVADAACDLREIDAKLEVLK